MSSRTQAERDLILYIGDELTRAGKNVVSNTGLEGKVSALRSLNDSRNWKRNWLDNQSPQASRVSSGPNIWINWRRSMM